ncbi:MAG: HNH endonuclease [Armatimonadetes bacterium]|nr:HNH endonuclease [Armatimonadota bacterium]
MARIRTIKPEFWTDEKIVMLPYEARLLFVGIWNFCDDDGYIVDEPARIQMQVLPADDIDADALIDLLCAASLLERCIGRDGRSVLRVVKFLDHQKISHPSPSKFRDVPFKKCAIPADTRRKVAIKYRCQPGGEVEASCYHCGAPGRIWWPRTSKGKPSFWVAFSGLELDHLEPEHAGGSSTPENVVLSCMPCNRGRGNSGSHEFFLRKAPEDSGVLRPERKGEERIDADPIARTRDDLNRIEAACREAAGCGKSANPSPELCNLAPILGLIDSGADLEGDILPALRLKPNPRARGWKYFIPQIQQFRADRLAAASAGLPNARDGPPRRATFAEINRAASEALRERDYHVPEPQPANLVVLAGPRQGIG